MSAEMYNFHEAIDELQRAEEEVLDNHKAISDYLQHSLTRVNQLLAITRDVDYDQDGKRFFLDFMYIYVWGFTPVEILSCLAYDSEGNLWV